MTLSLEATFQFAIYQPIAALPTPASSSANYVPVTITSTPTGAPVTVTGTGCGPGTYPTPANLLWDANSNCTLAFTAFYLRDPETGAVFNDNQQYVFANATAGSGAPVSANPQTISVGTGPLTINAVFNPAPLSPPAQNSVLEFSAGQQIAVAAQPVSVGSDFTLETWVSASQSPNGFIMGKIATGDTSANYAIIGTVGMLAFLQSTTVPATFLSITVSTPSPVPLNTWIHVIRPRRTFLRAATPLDFRRSARGRCMDENWSLAEYADQYIRRMSTAWIASDIGA